MRNITNEVVTEFLDGYYKPLNNRLGELREIGERDGVPIIQKDTEAALNTFLSLTRPKKILEIGTAIGYSTLYFATFCKDAEIYTIEKDEDMYNAAQKNFAANEEGARIHSLLGDGEEQIENLREKGITDFDFVFIDAAKSHYRRFFDASVSVCKDNAMIISDNILIRGMTASYDIDRFRKHRTHIRNMRAYLDYITSKENLETSLMAIGDGIAVTIYRGENG